MNDTKTILVIEDERQIREAVATALECEGFTVFEAGTVSYATAEAAARRPDLVILDLGLPDRDGLHFIRDYRAWSQIPILVLSARTEESVKVDALDAGADDYLSKPFGVAELLARVRVLLRRPQIREQISEPTIRFGDFEINCINRVVERSGQPLHLTQIEYRLLVFLAANPGRVLTHRHLLTQIWGGQAADNNQYLRVYVGHLRQKIEEDTACPRHILTELGVGYRFEP
jgi:two-component system KDP operon response regulator KdpE